MQQKYSHLWRCGGMRGGIMKLKKITGKKDESFRSFHCFLHLSTHPSINPFIFTFWNLQFTLYYHGEKLVTPMMSAFRVLNDKDVIWSRIEVENAVESSFPVVAKWGPRDSAHSRKLRQIFRHHPLRKLCCGGCGFSVTWRHVEMSVTVWSESNIGCFCVLVTIFETFKADFYGGIHFHKQPHFNQDLL